MDDFRGKTAYVSGAASGIGLAIARNLAEAGMNLAISDIESGPLERAAQDLAGSGVEVLPMAFDVGDRAAVKAAARRIGDTFGKLHVLVNNAGVGASGIKIDEATENDWDWAVSVNLMSVVNTGTAFFPLMKAHGEGGHVVNVASMAGLRVMPGYAQGLYATTKFAVVGYSEALVHDLAPHGIGVSVLCPGGTKSNIFQSGRNRPAEFGGPFVRSEDHPLAKHGATGTDPAIIAARVRRAIEQNELYIITHSNYRGPVEERHDRLMAAFDLSAELEKEEGR